MNKSQIQLVRNTSPSLPAPTPDDVRRMAEKGEKIPLVRFYRTYCNSSLTEAKNFVEAYQTGRDNNYVAVFAVEALVKAMSPIFEVWGQAEIPTFEDALAATETCWRSLGFKSRVHLVGIVAGNFREG